MNASPYFSLKPSYANVAKEFILGLQEEIINQFCFLRLFNSTQTLFVGRFSGFLRKQKS